MRSFAKVTGPLLRGRNGLANAVLRRGRVEPVNESTVVQGPVELQLLLSTSGAHGLIEPGQERQLSNVIKLAATPIHAVTLPLADVITIPLAATASDVEAISVRSGRSRLVALDSAGRPIGLVHVRDAVLGRADHPMGQLVYRTVALDQHDTLLSAMTRMRAARAQLGLVTRANPETPGTPEVLGITALEDLIEEVLGEFNDETDHRTLTP